MSFTIETYNYNSDSVRPVHLNAFVHCLSTAEDIWLYNFLLGYSWSEPKTAFYLVSIALTPC